MTAILRTAVPAVPARTGKGDEIALEFIFQNVAGLVALTHPPTMPFMYRGDPLAKMRVQTPDPLARAFNETFCLLVYHCGTLSLRSRDNIVILIILVSKNIVFGCHIFQNFNASMASDCSASDLKLHHFMSERLRRFSGNVHSVHCT